MRLPTEAQRNVTSMHTEVIERAALSALGAPTLPVGGLVGIQIAAVMEATDHLQHTAQRTTRRIAKSSLRPWEKRHLRTATHEPSALFHRSVDPSGGI